MKLILTLALLFSPAAFSLGAEPPSALAPQAQEAVSRAFLAYFVREFNQSVKSGEDYVRFLNVGVPSSQKQELKNYFASLGPAPRLELNKDQLIYHFPDYDIHVRWPAFAKNQVYIEGMAWVFDPTAPAKFQFDSLEAKLKSYAKNNPQASNWILPAADAGVLSVIGKAGSKALEKCIAQSACKWVGAGVGGSLLVNVGTDAWAGLKTGSYNLSCLVLSPAKPWYWGFCMDWKKQWDKADEYEKAREPAKTDSNSDWIPNQDAQCPRDDKGNEFYDAWIGETVKTQDGKWRKNGRWYHFYGIGKDSKFTEAYILSGKQKDAKEPDESDVQFVYTKTEKPTLERVRIKDKGTFVPILVTDQDSIIPVHLREDNRRLKLIAAAAEEWYKTCRRVAKGAKVAPEIMEEAVKQMQEQVDKTTTNPVPAPVTQ